MTSSASFLLAGTTAIAQRLSQARSDVASPSGGLVFLAGTPPAELDRIVDAVRTAWRGVPACIVPAAGVINERGEIEGSPGVSGLLWSGGRTSAIAGEDAAALAKGLEVAAGGKSATAIIFPRSDFSPDHLRSLELPAHSCLFGAGTIGAPAVALNADGEAHGGLAAGLVLTKMAAPIVESSASCKLVSPLRRIDEMSGGLVLSVEGTPALDALSSCMRSATEGKKRSETGSQPVVFAALAEEGTDPEEAFVVRPIRGVDPGRKALMIGQEARPGMRLGFAVRDAATGRSGVEAAAREVARKATGAAPRFAIHLSCAGRGQGLYGAADVEARILRQRFGDLPIAGMHSGFEISPSADGRGRLTMYTAVLALFRAPS